MDAVDPEGAHPPEPDGIEGLVDARVRAAGGVVGREGPDGIEVVLVHRPRFDDWSLPKGKLKRGEHPLVGAVREVREETGIRGVLGPRLPTVQYDVWARDALVEKSVDYWAMTIAGNNRPAFNAGDSTAGDSTAGDSKVGDFKAGDFKAGDFKPGDEVDEIAWLPVGKALSRLSYPHDKRVLRAYAELPQLRRPIVLLRHASAGERDHWSGPDEERPLDPGGHRQSAALARLLLLFGPARLVSAQPLRCQETMAPLAVALGLPVGIDARFNETTKPHIAAAALRSLADPDASVVVCSQGGLIPAAISSLNGGSAGRYHVSKADGWVLSFAETRLAALDAFTLAG